MATTSTEGTKPSKEPEEKPVNKKKEPEEKKPDRNYSLIREIRENGDYKHTVTRRDAHQRRYFEQNISVSGPKDIMPGQLISFNYFEPKTREDLEYYDAMPMTIFFGIFKNKDGERRVIGFNIHYYPPRIRYQVMDRIMEIWKPMYLKSWEDGLNKDLTHFDYKWLTDQLESMGLGFGVRTYVPNLIAQVRVIPPKDWVRAVFTEGRFKKKTREAILQYWKQFAIKHKA